MINSVRNTVLSVLNKNNYGYISPADFNLFAKQAQLDIFEDYQYQYNYQVNAENARRSGTALADIKKGYEEVLNSFSRGDFLSHISGNNFSVPTALTTGFDYFFINNVFVYTTQLAAGTTDATVVNELRDATKNFVTLGVQVNDVVVNTATSAAATVIENPTTGAPGVLKLNANIFANPASGETYVVYDGQYGVNEAEKVLNDKIILLNRSLLTTPTNMFPAYVQNEDTLTLYPNTVTQFGMVRCQYLRYPKDPKWTYVNLTGGEPVFDQSQPDFQDFELPLDDEPTLVMKILQYAGMSIREAAAVQFAKGDEQYQDQEEKVTSRTTT